MNTQNRLSRIVQVTPGIIPIPPNGWGAVEKVIWEYKKQLEFLGYDVSILYADQVEKNDDQVVHVHMANLANLLHERGIDYVFSMHDHHVEHFGKESQCYKDNYAAIKNARLAFVHSPHLLEYFDNMPNIVYLQHGANLTDYVFTDRSKYVKESPSLAMMANNGLGGDPLFDRKGFLIGIEAAKKIGLPLTIICPGSNRQFFSHHLGEEDPKSEDVRVLYDLDYESSLEELGKHSIFLNPSCIEAGHPNLTVTESIACGIPVVGTSFVDLPGLVRCQRNSESLAKGIVECLIAYDSKVEEIRSSRYKISWNVVVTKMLQNYKKYFSVSEKAQLEWQYSKTAINRRKKQEKNGVIVEFSQGRAFLKTSLFSEGLSAVFTDRKTNRIIYETQIGKSPGQWAYMWAPGDQFIDWEVSLNFGTITVHTERLELEGKKVLITGNATPQKVHDFCDTTGCLVTLRDTIVGGHCHDPNANQENFYTTINEQQLTDFFVVKPKSVDRYLLILQSVALGDSIGFLPYAQRWAQDMAIHVDVSLSRPEMFRSTDYPNLRLLKSNQVNNSAYNRVYRFEYLFDRPLQKGYNDQFGLEWKEIPAKIAKSGKERPMKDKYVVFGVQTTTQCKYWNYPDGWEKLSKMIKKEGLTPVSVDKYESFGIEGWWNFLPNSSTKKVGMNFDEVIRWIEHCEVFIGVSSGLAWLAYGLGKKVVMITGTTTEGNEFEINNTVVSNRSVCNGCFNRPELYKFNSGNWLWCPVHKGTKKQFECTKTITPEMVMNAVKENL
jgi:autotransporter strand-loop-strand O-heptosyltransferase